MKFENVENICDIAVKYVNLENRSKIAGCSHVSGFLAFKIADKIAPKIAVNIARVKGPLHFMKF